MEHTSITHILNKTHNALVVSSQIHGKKKKTGQESIHSFSLFSAVREIGNRRNAYKLTSSIPWNQLKTFFRNKLLLNAFILSSLSGQWPHTYTNARRTHTWTKLQIFASLLLLFHRRFFVSVFPDNYFSYCFIISYCFIRTQLCSVHSAHAFTLLERRLPNMFCNVLNGSGDEVKKSKNKQKQHDEHTDHLAAESYRMCCFYVIKAPLMLTVNNSTTCTNKEQQSTV